MDDTQMDPMAPAPEMEAEVTDEAPMHHEEGEAAA